MGKRLQVSDMLIYQKSAPASEHNQMELCLMATGLVRQADKTALMAYRVNKLYRPLTLPAY